MTSHLPAPLTALIASWRKEADDADAQAIQFDESGLPISADANRHRAKLIRRRADELEAALRDVVAPPDDEDLALHGNGAMTGESWQPGERDAVALTPYHPFASCTKGCGFADGVMVFCAQHQPEMALTPPPETHDDMRYCAACQQPFTGLPACPMCGSPVVTR